MRARLFETVYNVYATRVDLLQLLFSLFQRVLMYFPQAYHTNYARRQSRLAWVGCSSPSVCVFVCLFVSPEHNSKTKHPKVFKVGIGNELGMS